MGYRPPSAISLFTAVGLVAVLAGGVIALHGEPVGCLIFWCVALSAVIAFNLWAWRGSRRKR